MYLPLVLLIHSAFSLPTLLKSTGSSNSKLPATVGLIDCVLCKTTVKGIQEIVELNATFKEFYPLAVKLCESVLEKISFDGEYMCPGIISAYGIPVQLVASQLLFDPVTICRDLHICTSTPTSSAWPVTFDNFRLSLHKLLNKRNSGRNFLSKPPLELSDYTWQPNLTFDVHNSSYEQGKPLRKKPIQPKSGNITFLQIADIHLDLEYAEGSPTDCSLYFCCRSWYNGTGSAGHYGTYGCDPPKRTLDLLLEAITKNVHPAPDFIIYTGDNPPHDVWNETWNSQVGATQRIVDYFAEKMPTMSIYPAMGNHESWPANEYTGIYKEYQVLTHNLSVFWEKWVDLSLEAKATISHGGYYSLQVMEGLRIISFNTNYGYLYNFYSFLNHENRHYAEQWEWLERELRRARDRDEKVLMIGHIPPGNEDNWGEYGELYLNITKHFKGTIIGHIFGHTHMDHFQLIQDEDGVYGVVLVAPSVTPFGHINPSFRTFTMDADTMQLLSYTQYTLDLPKANDLYAHGYEDEVTFVPSYTTYDEYQLNDLSPDSWSKLSKKFVTNPELLNSYYYSRHGRSKPENRVCDDACRKQMLCEVNHIISTDTLLCLVD